MNLRVLRGTRVSEEFVSADISNGYRSEHLDRVLKVKSDYFDFYERTAGDFIRDAKAHGIGQAVKDE